MQWLISITHSRLLSSAHRMRIISKSGKYSHISVVSTVAGNKRAKNKSGLLKEALLV